MRQRQLCSIAALLVTFFAHSATVTLAQQPVDPVVNSLHEKVKLFFERVSSGSPRTAYQELLKSGPLASREDIESVERETARIEELYGAYRGFDPVYTKRVGSDLIFVKYLYKCSRFPVLWHVTFYRTPASGELGPDTWQVVSIRFDTDLELLTLLKD